MRSVDPSVIRAQFIQYSKGMLEQTLLLTQGMNVLARVMVQ